MKKERQVEAAEEEKGHQLVTVQCPLQSPLPLLHSPGDDGIYTLRKQEMFSQSQLIFICILNSDFYTINHIGWGLIRSVLMILSFNRLSQSN